MAERGPVGSRFARRGTGPRVRPGFAGVLLGTLAACHGIPEAVMETPEGRVVAYRGMDAEETARALAAVAPRVRDILGTEREPPLVRVGVTVPGLAYGAATPSEIWIEETVDDLVRVVAHELVHWYALGPWERLPPGIEDGLAHHVGRAFAGLVDVRIESPTWEDLDLALQPDPRRWRREITGEAALAALWVVCKTGGVEPLRAMCLRAQAEGHATIPPLWFLDHLDARPYVRGAPSKRPAAPPSGSPPGRPGGPE